MIFSARAPVRISLCNGGDTDYYIKEMGWGNLINATLATHNYWCIAEPKKQNFIKYTYINKFHKKFLNCIINPDQKKIDENMKLIVTTIKEINPEFRGDMQIITNVPEKSGLGGSSSLVVSLIKTLAKTKGYSHSTPEEIARLAYKIEREILGIKGGYQDQWAATFGGGVNYLEFRKNKNIFIEPLWLHEKTMKYLEDNLLLFHLEPRKGNSSEAHNILEKKLKKNKKESLSIMIDRRNNVMLTREVLLSNNLKKLAELLNDEQRKKELLNPKTITENSKVIYEEAINSGALGGKVSGTGKGGCAFFICKKQHQLKIIKNLKMLDAIHIQFKLQRLSNMGEF